MPKINIELPCNIGDMIYGLNKDNSIWRVEIEYVSIRKNSNGYYFKFHNDHNLFFSVYSYQIGKDVFLTYEDIEKHKKKIEKEKYLSSLKKEWWQ